MTYYLIITALTVSIDSFVCGFSLSFNSKRKLPLIVIIALTVFIMCAIVNYSTQLFANKISEKTASFGGLILICVGLYNIIKNKREPLKTTSPRGLISQSVLTGFAVGLDGALANLSLSLMGINQFYVPITIAIMHALMIGLGICLAETPLAKKFAKIEFLPPLVLIILGGYKLLGLFI